MSTDNVTPFPSSGPPSKPKKRKAERVGLKFGTGDSEDRTTLDVYIGLRGVCHALNRAGGTTKEIDLYADLSAAAAVLVGILEERLLLY